MNHNPFVVVSLVAALALLGCRPKSAPAPQPNPQASNMTDGAERISDLQRFSVELTAIAKNLPGRDASEDRELLGDAFDRATSALTLLMGPEPGGAFRQQLRIIDNVRADVRGGRASDATIDSGIRSIFNALIGVRDRLFGTDANARAQLDTLRDRVDELDSVRGPLHSVAVARALQAASAVIETMTAQLEGRANGVAATQPAQGPTPPQSFAVPGDIVERS